MKFVQINKTWYNVAYIKSIQPILSKTRQYRIVIANTESCGGGSYPYERNDKILTCQELPQSLFNLLFAEEPNQPPYKKKIRKSKSNKKIST